MTVDDVNTGIGAVLETLEMMYDSFRVIQHKKH